MPPYKVMSENVVIAASSLLLNNGTYLLLNNPYIPMSVSPDDFISGFIAPVSS